jgi:hypothetical protein
LFAKPPPLTIDSDLIYAIEPPSVAEYHLSSPLSMAENTIFVHRSEADPDQNFRDENIYEISRPSGKDEERFSIVGQTEATLIGSLKRSLAITGHRWSFRDHGGKEILAFASRTWRNDRGQVMAIEDTVIRKKKEGSQQSNSQETVEMRPLLQMSHAVGTTVVDLIVTLWVAKCWYAETMGKKEVPMRSPLQRGYT